MTWITLAASNASPIYAAQVMRCDPAQARRRLAEALTQLARRRENCLKAAALLTHSGYRNPNAQPAMSARNWQDVALGLKRAP